MQAVGLTVFLSTLQKFVLPNSSSYDDKVGNELDALSVALRRPIPTVTDRRSLSSKGMRRSIGASEISRRKRPMVPQSHRQLPPEAVLNLENHFRGRSRSQAARLVMRRPPD